MGHDAVFTEVFARHLDASRLMLHPVEDIGVETAVRMQEAIGRGELVLMAGDRVSAGSERVLRNDFLGRQCVWPKGAFVFAKLMEAPVFFVTCVRTGWNAYEVHVREFLPSGEPLLQSLLDAYVRFLEEETLTFLNRATKVRLGSIPESSVRQYYSSAFSRSQRSIAVKTLRDAAAATEGFPYMLQLIGYYLVSLTSEGGQITSETLDEALVLARADLDENVFLPMVRPLSQTDVAFLEAMAHDDGTSRIANIQKRLGMSQGSVQSYRKRLIEAGVVISPRRGEVCFVVPMLAEYLRRGKSQSRDVE